MTPSETIPKITAWSRNSPNSAPEFWLKTRRTKSPTTLDRPRPATAGRPARPSTSWSRTTTVAASPKNDEPVRAGPARDDRPLAGVPRPPPSPSSAVTAHDPRRDAGRSRPGRRRARRSPRDGVGGGVAVGERRERVGRDRREVGGHGVRDARRSTARSGRRARARRRGAGPGWPARARGRRLRRAARASARCRGRRPGHRRSATAVPGRGVAWISTSSGASVTPPSVTEPSSSKVDLAGPGRGHHRGDRRPEPLPDLGQERLDPPLDEGRLVVDDARRP